MPLLFTPNIAQSDSCTERAEYCWNCISKDGNLTHASTIYKQNLHSLLTSFVLETNNNYGFYNSSWGQNPDKVNAIALCRGDVVPNECRDCIKEASKRLLMNCPNGKEAIIWGERCLVRYSNSSIFYMMKEAPFKLVPSPNPSKAGAERYKKTLDPLLESLIRKASSGDSRRKFAYGNTKVPDAEDIYALVQCTPDLSQQDCSDCLVNSTLQIPGCCAGKSGGRVLKPSCTLRYEYGAFYNVPPPDDSCTERAEYCWNCISEHGNLTYASTIYKQNLHSLLTSFVSETNNNDGFYNSSWGQNPDKVNATALCRGDIVPNECRDCINEASKRILMNCPNRKEAIIWGERCLVRYYNSAIFYTKKEAPFKLVPSPNPSKAGAERYKKTLDPLLESLIRKASSGDSLRKFAYGNTKVPDAEDIYALVQCTPDLSQQGSSDCLVNSTLEIPGCCAGKSAGRVLKPSCTLRYEYGAFYNVSEYGGLPPPDGT
ncbi:putative cysteine-rich receptor-like protein kinase 23 [Ziziphus jujuba]|uniref:Cysteine-rich receptor-like protein kinase 23 n=1 Tax=Ziziphus jujuba TaxID=326968 RepID=A0A6P4AJV7_ZIZJJ|nr:putative cysteine-rich receptor-like protein kinase 23 [Ziziphus jujuba]